jgi:hypothetical protein
MGACHRHRHRHLHRWSRAAAFRIPAAPTLDMTIRARGGSIVPLPVHDAARRPLQRLRDGRSVDDRAPMSPVIAGRRLVGMTAQRLRDGGGFVAR